MTTFRIDSHLTVDVRDIVNVTLTIQSSHYVLNLFLRESPHPPFNPQTGRRHIRRNCHQKLWFLTEEARQKSMNRLTAAFKVAKLLV